VSFRGAAAQLAGGEVASARFRLPPNVGMLVAAWYSSMLISWACQHSRSTPRRAESMRLAAVGR
jgi:hypothetical protein